MGPHVLALLRVRTALGRQRGRCRFGRRGRRDRRGHLDRRPAQGWPPQAADSKGWDEQGGEVAQHENEPSTGRPRSDLTGKKRGEQAPGASSAALGDASRVRRLLHKFATPTRSRRSRFAGPRVASLVGRAAHDHDIDDDRPLPAPLKSRPRQRCTRCRGSYQCPRFCYCGSSTTRKHRPEAATIMCRLPSTCNRKGRRSWLRRLDSRVG